MNAHTGTFTLTTKGKGTYEITAEVESISSKLRRAGKISNMYAEARRGITRSVVLKTKGAN